MARVTCSFCRLPFHIARVREGAEYYCCSGCALASRIPVQDGQLPVSPGLLVALAAGFGLFNQVLFGVLGAAVAAEGRPETGEKLVWVSVAIGAVVLLGFSGLLVLARTRRWSDGVVLLPALAAGVWASVAAARGTWLEATIALFVANLLLALWSSRGWFRRMWARRTQDRSSAAPND
jgi:LPXTG-motif cell wall-anchored protein